MSPGARIGRSRRGEAVCGADPTTALDFGVSDIQHLVTEARLRKLPPVEKINGGLQVFALRVARGSRGAHYSHPGTFLSKASNAGDACPSGPKAKNGCVRRLFFHLDISPSRTSACKLYVPLSSAADNYFHADFLLEGMGSARALDVARWGKLESLNRPPGG